MKAVQRVLRVLLLVVFGIAAGGATAQYPSKPIRLIVPFPAGGAAELARVSFRSRWDRRSASRWSWRRNRAATA